MNAVLSRPPGRRGGRRPGWTLMTALLILAIAASSALVFTSRVELLKLAVIVALWAAVAAAFVSVIYRRQSDVDQARARDLKLVYDLQLDREISARREYELTVESQLRRELASELRAQAADEVAALRTELAALRTNLEILFDADLSQRAALESERTTVRAYSDWARSGGESVTTRVTRSAYHEDAVTETAENPIIDVPEVRIPTGGIPMPQPPQPSQPAHSSPPPPAKTYRGSHRRAVDSATPDASHRPAEETRKPQPAAGRWGQPPQPFVPPEPRRGPEPPSQPTPQQPWAAPPAAPKPPWKPVAAEGEWLPPGTPGSNWSADVSTGTGRHGVVGHERGPDAPARPGRHAGPDGPADTPVNGTELGRPDREGRRARSRHSAGSHAQEMQVEPSEPVPASAFVAPSRHATGTDAGGESAPSAGGQSVADLLARLQPGGGEGGRRRRRDD